MYTIYYRPQRSCEGYVSPPPAPDQAHPRPGTPQTRHPSGPGTHPDQAPAQEQTPTQDQAPPQEQTPTPGPGTPPPDQAHLPPSKRLPLRMVRILLECILVEIQFSQSNVSREFAIHSIKQSVNVVEFRIKDSHLISNPRNTVKFCLWC